MIKFVKVKNIYLDSQNNRLSPKELYLYCFLKYKLQGRDVDSFSINQYLDFVKEESYISYSEKKSCRVSKMKDKRVILPVLISLEEKGLLVVNKDLNKIKVSDFVEYSIVDIETEDGGFESVSYEFIKDMFDVVGVYGFYIYVYLKKNYISEPYNISLDRLSSLLGLGVTSTYSYLCLLESLDLISIKSSKVENKNRASNSEILFANGYIVNSKNKKSDKYYVSFDRE